MRKGLQYSVWKTLSALLIILYTLMSTATSPTEVNAFDPGTILEGSLPEYLLTHLKNNLTNEAIQGYCPLLKTCYKTQVPPVEEETGEGCCISCDCDDDCFARASCCYDKEPERYRQPNNGTWTIDGRNCVSAFSISTQSIFQNALPVLLAGTCPFQYAANKTVDVEIRNRCLYPNDSRLDDITPVTSNVTFTNYRNKFCAICHNDTSNLLVWSQEIRCESGAEITPFWRNDYKKKDSFSIDLSFNQCDVKWQPPNGVLVETCYHLHDYVSSCPSYTPNYLKELCEGENALFIPYVGFVATYKNIFCLSCNLLEFTETMYDPLPNGRCLPLEYVHQPTHSLTVLLDLAFLKSKDVSDCFPDGNVSKFECDEGMTFNSVLETCLDLVCSYTSMKVADVCMPIVKKISGVNFQYKLDFVFNANEQPLPSELLLREAVTYVLDEYEDEDDICEKAIVRRKNNNDTFIVETIVIKTIKMPTVIEDEFDRLKSTVLAYENLWDNANISFRIAIGKYPLDVISLDKEIFLRFQNRGSCSGLIAMTDLQFCRLVVFRNFLIMTDSSINIDGVIFESHEYFLASVNSHLKAHICEETYIRVMMLRGEEYTISCFSKAPLHFCTFILCLLLLLDLTKI